MKLKEIALKVIIYALLRNYISIIWAYEAINSKKAVPDEKGIGKINYLL